MVEEAKTTDERYAALEARFKELEAKSGEREKQLRADLIRSMNLRPQTEAAAPKAPAAPDYKGLPDPDDENYHEELAKRQAVWYQQVQAAQAAQGHSATSQKARADALIEEFKRLHPEQAKDMERVRIAADLAWSKGQQRGMDMDRFAYGSPELFFEDVLSEHARLFGKGEVVEKREEPETMERALGIFGGMEGHSAPKGREERVEELGSLTGDLKSLQKTAGLSW